MIIDNSDIVNSKVWNKLKEELEKKLNESHMRLEKEKDVLKIAYTQGQIALIRVILSYETSEDFNAS